MSKTPTRTRQVPARKRKLAPPAPLFDCSRASREELAAHRDRVNAWLAVYVPPTPEPESPGPGAGQLPFSFHRDIEPLYVLPWVERELGKYHTLGELGVLRQPAGATLARVSLACRSTQRWDRANWLWSMQDDGEHAASFVRLLCDAWAAELKHPDWDRRSIDELLEEVHTAFLSDHAVIIEERGEFRLCRQPTLRDTLPWAVRECGYSTALENFATEGEARAYFLKLVAEIQPSTATPAGAS